MAHLRKELTLCLIVCFRSLSGKIRMGLMTHGVDVMGAPGGFVSAMHGGAEIEKTVHALRMTVRALKAEREVKAA